MVLVTPRFLLPSKWQEWPRVQKRRKNLEVMAENNCTRWTIACLLRKVKTKFVIFYYPKLWIKRIGSKPIYIFRIPRGTFLVITSANYSACNCIRLCFAVAYGSFPTMVYIWDPWKLEADYQVVPAKAYDLIMSKSFRR